MTLLQGQGDGTFTASAVAVAGGPNALAVAVSVAVADVNADGALDLAVGPINSNQVSIPPGSWQWTG